MSHMRAGRERERRVRKVTVTGPVVGIRRERAASKLFSSGHHRRRGTTPKFQPFNFRWYDNSWRYFTRVWNLAQRGFYCGCKGEVRARAERGRARHENFSELPKRHYEKGRSVKLLINLGVWAVCAVDRFRSVSN